MDALKVYLAICLFALLVSTAVRLVYRVKRNAAMSHEKEHDLGNYIKIFILILLGLLLLYLSYSGQVADTLSITYQ
jgi:hypothetical protein